MSERKDANSGAPIQLIAAGILFSIILCGAIGIGGLMTGLFPEDGIREGEDPLTFPVTVVFVLFGCALSLLSFPIRRLMLANLPKEGVNQTQLTQVVVVGMAVTESSAVAGLVYILLTGDLLPALLLFGVSLATAILNFPTRGWLETHGGEAFRTVR